jgi:hypothetical protein
MNEDRTLLSKIEYTIKILRLPNTEYKKLNDSYIAEYLICIDNENYLFIVIQKIDDCQLIIIDSNNKIIFRKKIIQKNRIWLHETNKSDGSVSFFNSIKEFNDIANNNKISRISDSQISYIIKRDNKIKELGIGC